MLRAVLLSLVIGLLAVTGVGLATSGARSPNPDVDEVHILLAGDDPLVPAGSQVKLQCQLTDGSGYLATALASLSSVTVLTVTAADLDGLPRGPFTETCEHWQQRHHVQTIE